MTSSSQLRFLMGFNRVVAMLLPMQEPSVVRTIFQFVGNQKRCNWCNEKSGIVTKVTGGYDLLCLDCSMFCHNLCMMYLAEQVFPEQVSVSSAYFLFHQIRRSCLLSTQIKMVYGRMSKMLIIALCGEVLNVWGLFHGRMSRS